MSEVNLSYELDVEPNYNWTFVSTTGTAQSYLPYFQEVGDFPAGKNYYTKRENLRSYMMSLTVDGEGILVYGGKMYHLTPGKIYWIDCSHYQYFYTNPNVGHWHTTWVHFYGSGCAQYYDLFTNSNGGSPVISVANDSGFKFLLTQAIDIYKNADTTLNEDLQAAALINGLMIRSIQAVSPASQNKTEPKHVTDIRDYISTHYNEQITLDTLAEAMSLNKFYLQKLFKKYTGVTPNEYLIRTRMLHVKELLYSTDEPISRIALDVGFNNLGHFIELFKSREGVSPSVFRRSWYKNNLS